MPAAGNAISGGEFTALIAVAVLAAILQIAGIVSAARRGRPLWALAIWFTFPLGVIAWFAYGRKRAATDE
jgi:hypothetical protein